MPRSPAHLAHAVARAFAVVLASVAPFACGGGNEQLAPAVAPVPEPTVAPSAVASEAPSASAEPVASPSPGAASAEPPAPKSLYERLGGKDAITKIVRESLKNVTNDKRLSKPFGKATKDPKKLEAIEADLIDLLCARTGGPCESQDPKAPKLKEAEWQAVLEDVRAALDTVGVTKPEQDELMTLLGQMKDAIVEAPKK